MGNIETTPKISRLQSIEDNYPEATTGCVLYKKLFLKFSQYSLENTCVGVSF